MISSISFKDTPCFAPSTELSELKLVNFVFGPNGSGKSTISRILRDADPVAAKIDWQTGRSHDIRVYNQDYVRSAFGTTEGMPGVFRFGPGANERADTIKELQQSIEQVGNRLRKYQIQLGSPELLTGKYGEIARIKDELQTSAWSKRHEVPKVLWQCFPGIQSNKKQLMDIVIETALNHADASEDWHHIETEAASAFDASTTVESHIPLPPAIEDTMSDYAEVLAAPIIGSGDTRLKELVDKISAHDWVQHGRKFLDYSTGVCPLCQQSVPADLIEQLDRLFDERYARQLAQVSRMRQGCEGMINKLSKYIDENMASLVNYADEDVVEAVCARAVDAYKQLLTQSHEKLSTPSLRVEAMDVDLEITPLVDLISEVNTAISAHNKIVQNRKKMQVDLKERARIIFCRRTLVAEVARFEASVDGPKKAIKSLTEKEESDRACLKTLRESLSAEQLKGRSSDHVIHEINGLLESVGFHSFSLAKSSSHEDGYVVIRSDRSHAAGTLSEGERTFLTFLYYYHDLLGLPRDGDAEQIVAVIDDPISSLDSDILFYVSTLIRKLVRNVEQGTGRISQLILMTHNSFFYNEVTYKYPGAQTNSRSYYLIQKNSREPNTVSGPVDQPVIRSDYQRLWDEAYLALQKFESSPVGLPNTLRRICETYFSFVEGLSLTPIADRLEKNEQIVGHALMAWVNSGSHELALEPSFSPTNVSTSTWLEVFRNLFEKANHKAHYDMMMERAQNRLD